LCGKQTSVVNILEKTVLDTISHAKVINYDLILEFGEQKIQLRKRTAELSSAIANFSSGWKRILYSNENIPHKNREEKVRRWNIMYSPETSPFHTIA